MKDEQKDVFQEKQLKEWPKKPYATPRLTVHGTVEEITQALGTGTKDGLEGSLLL